MNTKNIKALISLMEKSGLSVIEITEGDTKIRLEKNSASLSVNSVSMPISDNKNALAAIQDQQVIDFNNIYEVKSPMVGVFYAAASPEASLLLKSEARLKKATFYALLRL
jgi:acetyl-CoA carboxylase biotin carboxyl carrier protein